MPAVKWISAEALLKTGTIRVQTDATAPTVGILANLEELR